MKSKIKTTNKVSAILAIEMLGIDITPYSVKAYSMPLRKEHRLNTFSG